MTTQELHETVRREIRDALGKHAAVLTFWTEHTFGSYSTKTETNKYMLSVNCNSCGWGHNCAQKEHDSQEVLLNWLRGEVLPELQQHFGLVETPEPEYLPEIPWTREAVEANQ